MSKSLLTSKEKIAKAKLDLKKAQEKLKHVEEKRKTDIGKFLFKLNPEIADCDDATLEKAFKDMVATFKKTS